MENKFHSVKPILNKDLPQVYIETYGCQMNVSDSEVIMSVLQSAGYSLCKNMDRADVILINTCAIIDNAEKRIWGRLDVFRNMKKNNGNLIVGVVGCMAERLKEKLLDNGTVDLVAGPDAYRKIGDLLDCLRHGGEKQAETILSTEETYADISPVRLDKNGVSAYISIMRGCNNICSYCIVPYTRGRERSRNPVSIVKEAQELFDNGYREVCLLGQNVNSYKWVDPENTSDSVDFAQLMELVALIDKRLRVRFSTSHPKDMSNDVLYTMAMYENICDHIHLPVQSGSNDVLSRMNRKYTREQYLERIAKIREIIPNCAITTDLIAGFSGETEEDHEQTLSLMEEVKYDGAYMFQYSERPGTTASRLYKDDVPPEVKTRRLNEIINLQNRLSLTSNKKEIGKVFTVLIDGISKKSASQLEGRTSQNKMCVFDAGEHKIGDYVNVKITSCTSATLIAEITDEKPEKYPLLKNLAVLKKDLRGIGKEIKDLLSGDLRHRDLRHGDKK
jgi:tRNA-2-methylthio-N6-dimethylallyladenosine synthase